MFHSLTQFARNGLRSLLGCTKRREHHGRWQPMLEALEDRIVPSKLVPISVSGEGSLDALVTVIIDDIPQKVPYAQTKSFDAATISDDAFGISYGIDAGRHFGSSRVYSDDYYLSTSAAFHGFPENVSSGSGLAKTTAQIVLQIVPEGEEKLGDSVTLHVGTFQIEATGDSAYAYANVANGKLYDIPPCQVDPVFACTRRIYQTQIGDTITLQTSAEASTAYGPNQLGSGASAGVRILRPDLKATELKWNNIEDGGGFTFTYEISEPVALGRDARIDFYWQNEQGDFNSEHLAYRVDISDETVLPEGVIIRSGGDDLKKLGSHTLSVSHAALLEFLKTVPSQPFEINSESDTFGHTLVMKLDPDDGIWESNEANNIIESSLAIRITDSTVFDYPAALPWPLAVEKAEFAKVQVELSKPAEEDIIVHLSLREVPMAEGGATRDEDFVWGEGDLQMDAKYKPMWTDGGLEFIIPKDEKTVYVPVQILRDIDFEPGDGQGEKFAIQIQDVISNNAGIEVVDAEAEVLIQQPKEIHNFNYFLLPSPDKEFATILKPAYEAAKHVFAWDPSIEHLNGKYHIYAFNAWKGISKSLGIKVVNFNPYGQDEKDGVYLAGDDFIQISHDLVKKTYEIANATGVAYSQFLERLVRTIAHETVHWVDYWDDRAAGEIKGKPSFSIAQYAIADPKIQYHVPKELEAGHAWEIAVYGKSITCERQTSTSRLRGDFGFHSDGNYYLNLYGHQEKWFKDRTGHWHFIQPDGRLHRWDGKGFEGSEVIAQVDPLVYDDPNLLFNAVIELSESMQQTMTDLRGAHGYFLHEDYYLNFYGHNEKWFKDRTGHWHFIQPDGRLHRWDGKGFEGSEVIAQVDPLVYDDPNLLFNAVIELSESMQQTLTELRRAHGFFLDEDYYLNLYGHQEKWFKDRTGHWHFIQPDGRLHRWDGKGFEGSDVIAQVDPLVYDDPHLLFDAKFELSESMQDQLSLLRYSYFHSDGNYYLNLYGQQEKWFKDRTGHWHFIQPDGRLYRWDGKGFEGSEVIAQLDPLVYDNPQLLFREAIAEIDANRMSRQAKEDLAGRKNLHDPNDIRVIFVRATDWSDSSLGAPEAGHYYLQMITPGFEIGLAYDGKLYRFHTNTGRSVKLVSEEALLVAYDVIE